jgi:hypothetical protein
VSLCARGRRPPRPALSRVRSVTHEAMPPRTAGSQTGSVSWGAAPRFGEGGAGAARTATHVCGEATTRRENADGLALFRFGTICLFRNVLPTGRTGKVARPRRRLDEGHWRGRAGRRPPTGDGPQGNAGLPRTFQPPKMARFFAYLFKSRRAFAYSSLASFSPRPSGGVPTFRKWNESIIVGGAFGKCGFLSFADLVA